MVAGDRVAGAMAAVPRVGFLPPGERHRARHDGPIAIGEGQTNSQPRTVAAMLALLDVRDGDTVLDVGAGSGWTTALLAHLTGPTGSITGVELRPAIAAAGAANLARTGMPWARLLLATPGVLGMPKDAPYDRILVSAEAGELPECLVAQLRSGGTMVIPIRGRMLRVIRTRDGHESSTHGHYRFVPLITT